MKLLRPTENTPFHIDYSWFEKNGQDVNVLIYKCLTPEQQERLAGLPTDEALDFVDEATGEVRRVTRAMQMIRAERANDATFISPRLPLAESVFRVFLLNDNQPLTPVELAARIGRKPSEILAQLGGRTVYNGVRPIMN
ncbi:MAG: hypothetical protein D6709_07030 [Chloroflexi bacterium]|jgi:hypothetical protein|uniref:Uncharacterized protein n=1 Tax=Candidatus Thermofonsia Clade 3 bacterium TaxID=2364212 RepID=A0A2M8QCI6_9CHLR|nr:hypothetical protein [Candidatus Roseilinea sp. NK_OTU-006]PJF47511.1 MAG: hypothetical protein CUN48_08155 [Candidatus Thermofonsia Clade 3 bacterium]RMG63890.1 MAG: hypothetical protein D6709_07030 [Chloroflexota bacterium]